MDWLTRNNVNVLSKMSASIVVCLFRFRVYTWHGAPEDYHCCFLLPLFLSLFRNIQSTCLSSSSSLLSNEKIFWVWKSCIITVFCPLFQFRPRRPSCPCDLSPSITILSLSRPPTRSSQKNQFWPFEKSSFRKPHPSYPQMNRINRINHGLNGKRRTN